MNWKGIISVVAGSCLYRMIVAIALRLNVPTEAFKLVSAIIVAIAIAMPKMKQTISEKKAASAARRGAR